MLPLLMRLIGHIKLEANARTFAGYLKSLDIGNQIEPDADGWAVWVYSEDQIQAGQDALSAFEQNPHDKKFQQAKAQAAAKEEQARKEARAYAKRVRTSDQIWSASGRAPLTGALIAICVGVYLVISIGPGPQVIRALQLRLTPVFAGEVWRLVTPIFLHFSIPHILFDMFILYDLGMMVERRQGTMRLALLVLGIAVCSNFAQYFFGGPNFGGMSGVDYGLLGYVWMRGHFDPNSGLFLSPTTIAIMLVWFFLCVFQIIPDVANWAHGGGLLVGMAWGAAPALKRR